MTNCNSKPFAVDRRGAVAIWVAMLAPVFMMALGVGIEVTSWSTTWLDAQRTADAAAVAGAMNYLQTQDPQKAATYAARVAEVNGAVGTASPTWDSSTQTLHDNTIIATFTNDGQNANQIAISLNKAVPLTLAEAFTGSSSVSVHAGSSAQNTANPNTTYTSTTSFNTGLGCIMVLDASSASALQMQNQGSKLDGKCEVIVNSSSATGTYLAGTNGNNGTITVNDLLSYLGGISQANVHWTQGWPISNPHKLTAAEADPYASQAAAATILKSTNAGTCIDIGGQPLNQTSGSITLNPGHYCKGWSISGSKTVVTLNAGVYYVDSMLNIQQGATVNALSGTTIVIGNAYSMNLNNGTINIYAPTSGATMGLALTEYNDSPSGGPTQYFNNGFELQLQGAVYFPRRTLYVQNGGVITSFNGTNGCAQLITRDLNIENSMSVGNNCGGIHGILPFGTQQTAWAQTACAGYANNTPACKAHAQITQTATTTYTWSTALSQ